MNQNWLWKWNYHGFEILFRHVPPRPRTVDWFQFVITNPLLSTWIFAAASYYYWTKDDGQRTWRRARLVQTVVLLAVLTTITLILRPWVQWPAPNLNPQFEPLFPQYLWGSGNQNCFPSHSTLAYFTVAVGFYPLNRWLSLGLMLETLMLVSLPRIYVGGHYPIDVLFSCLMASGGFILMRHWWSRSYLLTAADKKPASILCETLFFLWVFELGEAFRGSELLAGAMHHWWLRTQ
jgi:undecaprenyl-diphosphatase